MSPAHDMLLRCMSSVAAVLLCGATFSTPPSDAPLLCCCASFCSQEGADRARLRPGRGQRTGEAAPPHAFDLCQTHDSRCGGAGWEVAVARLAPTQPAGLRAPDIAACLGLSRAPQYAVADLVAGLKKKGIEVK